MTDDVVAPDLAVIEQNTAHVLGVLAEALAQHEFQREMTGPHRCKCGLRISRDDGAHAAHVASVVAALPNIAIVELPEPDTNDQIQHWAVGDISATEHGGLVWADLEPTVHGYEDARVVAANLLAAARVARGQS